MIIGIDVGGTHADGVRLEGEDVVAKKKVDVDHNNLKETIITLLKALLPENRADLQRIQLSTTLCTNAIIKNQLDDVGMFIQAGPGMNPEFLNCGRHTYFQSGALDHRGQVQRAPSEKEILAAASTLRAEGINSIGVVTKFSYRNNTHELWMRDRLADRFSHISMGHRLSGMPNFPRRVYTTWLNSGLMTRFSAFKAAMEEGLRSLDINCPCSILKADGGTIPFASGCEFPCQSIHSGPSASVMGALALYKDLKDTVLLDIGGTTTDISIFADGVPLLEPYGATVAGRPTLIRALQTRSIGLGGDSRTAWRNGTFIIGPENGGPPMSLGGTSPTPTDAMVLLGQLHIGSVEKAREAMRLLDPSRSAEETAAALLHCFAEKAHDAATEMLDEVFQRPVFTVSALLEREKIQPNQLIAIGGPAAAMQGYLTKRFGLDCIVPQDYEVANAIGAARARLTLQASLYADTKSGRLSIPECSISEPTGRNFTMMAAETRLASAIQTMAANMGMGEIPPIDIIERLEMNTVSGFSTTGKIINVKAQLRPGLANVKE